MPFSSASAKASMALPKMFGFCQKLRSDVLRALTNRSQKEPVSFMRCAVMVRALPAELPFASSVFSDPTNSSARALALSEATE